MEISTRLKRLLDEIDSVTLQDFQNLPDDFIERIQTVLTQEEFKIFMEHLQITMIFLKNIHLFGGINGYVDDFFLKNTVAKILAMTDGDGKRNAMKGALMFIKKMLTYPELNEENRLRLTQGIQLLTQESPQQQLAENTDPVAPSSQEGGGNVTTCRKNPFPWSKVFLRKSPFRTRKNPRKEAELVETAYRKGKKIGFTARASLKSMGRIPRSNGCFILGKKYGGKA